MADKKARQMARQNFTALARKVDEAQADLNVSKAKLKRLTKAKEILMQRAAADMSVGEAEDFARSIASFAALLEQVKKEVDVKEALLLRAKRALSAVE